jgi:hypothetical protein
MATTQVIIRVRYDDDPTEHRVHYLPDSPGQDLNRKVNQLFERKYRDGNFEILTEIVTESGRQTAVSHGSMRRFLFHAAGPDDRAGRQARNIRSSGPKSTDRPFASTTGIIFCSARPSVSRSSDVVRRRVRPGRRRRPRRHRRFRSRVARPREDLRLSDDDCGSQRPTPEARVRRRDCGVSARARPPRWNRRSSRGWRGSERVRRQVSCRDRPPGRGSAC